MNKEEAKQKIAELVDRFKDVVQNGQVGQYNEAQTKKDFIEPLFEALGWKIHNKSDVSVEEGISNNRVDYGFYIDGRIQFYLEAKAVREDLNKEKFANQAVQYSWNKGVTWAVLTDFENIKIFNAQDIDASLGNKLFKDISYADFLSRFDELCLLSKEAFKENQLDKEAEKHGKKRQKISVTKKLYDDLNESRELLTNKFLAWNEDLKKTRHLVDEGVQKVLDRIIFIRVAEDRKIESPILRPLVREWKTRWNSGKREKLLYQYMIEKFREFDAVYNSHIFAEHPSDKWEEHSNIVEGIIEKLYGQEGYYEYDFKAMSADVLGAVYEQYLGHKLSQAAKGDLFGTTDVVLAKDAKKRKQQGIYYTPTFIVDYIVKNTLGPVLEKCKSISDLQKIRVLDPACGSGSFLIKAFDAIYKKYDDFGSGGQEVKLQILVNNLYGVDLDEQAIEIARLNLLVAALEERRKLPNLTNIKNGNSLISGTDKELEKQFGKNWRDKKPFNWQEEFPEVFKQGGFDVIIGNPPYIKEDMNKNAFDGLHKSPYYQGKMDLWTMFACVSIDLLKESGVLSFIAPSSWVTNAGASIIRNKILTDGELKTFIDFGDYKVFEEAGIQTMIFVFEKKKPKEKYIVDYLRINDKDITEEKLVKEFLEEKIKIEIEPKELIDKNITFINSESDPILNKIIQKGNYYLLDDDLTQGIVPNPDVINNRNINKLSNSNVKINEGVFIIPKNHLNISDSEKKYLKPLFDTDQISRYLFDENNEKELIYIPKNEEISEKSMLIKHLSKYRPIMEERRENLKGSIKYYNLHWPRNPKYFKEGPKIISVRKCKIPTFSYTENECYVMLTFNIIKTDLINLKYLTAVLNSKLIYFWLKQKGKLQGDMFQIDTEPLQQIPICIGDESHQKIVINLVDKIISLNKNFHKLPENSNEWVRMKEEIEKVDKKINEEVYKLYGLTDKEIEIIENSK